MLTEKLNLQGKPEEHELSKKDLKGLLEQMDINKPSGEAYVLYNASYYLSYRVPKECYRDCIFKLFHDGFSELHSLKYTIDRFGLEGISQDGISNAIQELKNQFFQYLTTCFDKSIVEKIKNQLEK